MSFILPGSFIYLSHPRTASVATEDVLRRAFPEGIVTREHHAGIDSHEITGHIKGEEIIYTTVRDPLDAMASWYLLNAEWHKRGIIDFINQYHHKYLEKNGFMYYHYRDAGGNVLRYEEIRRDVAEILNTFGATGIKMSWLNTTKGKDREDFLSLYSEEAIAAMWKRFPWDMSLYHAWELR